MLARVLLLRIERWLEAEGVFDVAEFGDVVLAAELDRVARASRPPLARPPPGGKDPLQRE